MKQTLDQRQSQILTDLKVDMSNTLLSICVDNSTQWKTTVMPNHLANKLSVLGATLYPTLTIGELLGRLPEEINSEGTTYRRIIEYNNLRYQWGMDGRTTQTLFQSDVDLGRELIDNLFDTYLWFLEENY